MVMVTPEDNNKAVLMVGNQKGVMVVNGSTVPAGGAVAPAAMEGQTALKSGHKSAFFNSPNSGTE